MNASSSKNIALSPFGYWPRTRWRQFCGFVRCSMRVGLVLTTLLFLTLTGCSKSESTRLHLAKAVPSYLFAKAAVSIVVCTLEEINR